MELGNDASREYRLYRGESKSEGYESSGKGLETVKMGGSLEYGTEALGQWRCIAVDGRRISYRRLWETSVSDELIVYWRFIESPLFTLSLSHDLEVLPPTQGWTDLLATLKELIGCLGLRPEQRLL